MGCEEDGMNMTTAHSLNIESDTRFVAPIPCVRTHYNYSTCLELMCSDR